MWILCPNWWWHNHINCMFWSLVRNTFVRSLPGRGLFCTVVGEYNFSEMGINYSDSGEFQYCCRWQGSDMIHGTILHKTWKHQKWHVESILCMTLSLHSVLQIAACNVLAYCWLHSEHIRMLWCDDECVSDSEGTWFAIVVGMVGHTPMQRLVQLNPPPDKQSSLIWIQWTEFCNRTMDKGWSDVGGKESVIFLGCYTIWQKVTI